MTHGGCHVSRRAAEDIKNGSFCSLSVVGGSVFMNDVSSTRFYTMLHMSIFYMFSSTQNAEENSRQNTNDFIFYVCFT
jgi:hypothetical protein